MKLPLCEGSEEGGVEVQGRISDLLGQFAEEQHQMRVKGFSHAFATLSEKSPKFRQDAFLCIHVCPAILEQ